MAETLRTHWACFLGAVDCDTSRSVARLLLRVIHSLSQFVPEWSLKISRWLRSLERPDTNTEDHSRMNLSVSVCPGRVRHFMSFRFICIGIGRWTSWETKRHQEAIFHHYPPLNLLRNSAGVLAVSLGFHLMCKTEWTTCIALRFCSASEPLSIILYFAPV